MIKIRLARGGVRRKPFYKIVAIDDKQRAKGVPLEILGYWRPSIDDIKIDTAKVKLWVGKGAKLTKAVSSLLEGHKK
jgi:small subunit ribosomal protein S16